MRFYLKWRNLYDDQGRHTSLTRIVNHIREGEDVEIISHPDGENVTGKWLTKYLYKHEPLPGPTAIKLLRQGPGWFDALLERLR
jgi:hypothetical protein